MLVSKRKSAALLLAAAMSAGLGGCGDDSPTPTDLDEVPGGGEADPPPGSVETTRPEEG